MLAQFQSVSKAFASQSVLRGVSFQIDPGDKIGLIGTNGAGKTTLLRLLTGASSPDEGAVHRKAGLAWGSLDQIPDFHESTSVLDEALQAFRPLLDAERQMRDIEHRIATGDGTHSEDLDRYSTIQHAFELHGGYSFHARTEGALLGVGFRKESFAQPSQSLSGGEKNRLALAKLLLSEAELLLLDEPTNHLDIRSIEWLESFLAETPKAFLVVSHDRVFLDRVAGRIFEISQGRVDDYRGNYSACVRQRAERLARQQKEWELQKEWIENQEDYIRRNIAGQKTKQAQSRRKLLAKVKRIERPPDSTSRATFRFVSGDRGGRSVVRMRGLEIGYGQALASDLNVEVQRGERWAILGGNGSGKTTLLRTIVGSIPALSGELEWSESLDFGYYDQQLADLRMTAEVLEEIRSIDPQATDGELRGYLAQFLFSGDDVFKKVGTLSGGEKSRLALAKIIYEEPQLLALDEPTNHLDIPSREALEEALAAYPGTIIFITHDRYLAEKIATHLIYLEDGRAHVFDRLSAFEDWLTGRDTVKTPEPAEVSASAAAVYPVPAASAAPMSKNRRERLQAEAAALESRIASTEAEIASLEASFQNPDPSLDWKATHRRHAELQSVLDRLYTELQEHWDLLA